MFQEPPPPTQVEWIPVIPQQQAAPQPVSTSGTSYTIYYYFKMINQLLHFCTILGKLHDTV